MKNFSRKSFDQDIFNIKIIPIVLNINRENSHDKKKRHFSL